MIRIIFAPPRTGKTAYLTHTLNNFAFDRERNLKMEKAVLGMQEAGFNVSIPKHCVASNYEIEFRKFMYSRRNNYKINPFRLGYKNKFVKTHFLFPFQVIGITEAQKYLDSHMALYFPDWQSRFYEQHGHYDLEILLDTQRPELINANVRDLACFTEIVDLNKYYDKNNKIKKLEWLVKDIPNSSVYEDYKNSGKTLKLPERVEVEDNINVFDLYDSQNCKPKNFDGHFEEDFSLEFGKPPEENIEAYIKYLENLDDEMPEGFYQKRTNK